MLRKIWQVLWNFRYESMNRFVRPFSEKENQEQILDMCTQLNASYLQYRTRNENPKVIFSYFDTASIFIHPRDLVFADPSRLAGQRRGADLDGQAEAGGRRLHRLRCGRPQIAPRDPGRAFRFADTAERRTPADRKFRTGGAKLCYTSA